MVTIRATTQINAPLERCYRLSLSVDLEKDATGRKAVEGVTQGLAGPGEAVTWQGCSFGWRRHQGLIDVWRPFTYFRDVMISGSFAAYEHAHHFAVMDDGTRLRDEVRFTARGGILGRVAETLFLRRRMITLVRKRNAVIKQVAESEEWRRYLDGQPELDQRIYQSFSAMAIHEGKAFAK
jgi:ligand-binding SRPBCC domain-containing protein